MSTIVTPQHERQTYGAMFNIDEVIRANRASGSHFFDADTIRFFGSRVLPTVYGGRFFVTSERSGFEGSRREYTLREFMPDGGIETVGEFGAYGSSEAAKRAAQRASRSEVHTYYFDGQHGKAGRKRVYVVTANDPWEAMGRLHKNFRVQHMGRARDYMTDNEHYTVLA